MKSAIEEYMKAHKLSCSTRNGAQVCSCGLDAAKAELERLKALVHAARETRTAPKIYYDKGRLQGDLIKAKQWEKDLDKRLAGLWVNAPAEDTAQERLL